MRVPDIYRIYMLGNINIYIYICIIPFSILIYGCVYAEWPHKSYLPALLSWQTNMWQTPLCCQNLQTLVANNAKHCNFHVYTDRILADADPWSPCLGLGWDHCRSCSGNSGCKQPPTSIYGSTCSTSSAGVMESSLFGIH